MQKQSLHYAGLISLIVINILSGFILLFTALLIIIPQILDAQHKAGIVNAGTENTITLTLLSLLAVIATAVSIYLPWHTIQLVKQNKDATTMTWITGLLNILNFPLGTVASVLVLLPLFDPSSAQALKGKVD